MATLAEMQTRLAEYRAAESAILKSQEYTISDGQIQRRMRRADLTAVQAMIKTLEDDIEKATIAANRTRRVLYMRPGC
jgi:hypothetical protein